MYYIVTKAPTRYRQMTLDEYLFGGEMNVRLSRWNTTNTRTYAVKEICNYIDTFDINAAYEELYKFYAEYRHLSEVDRSTLYRSYKIPKKSGGLRPIDEPTEELMEALHKISKIFSSYGMLYHTSAFAYVKGRCCHDAVKRHQANESKWFLKTDLTNFFGSVTLDFTLDMLRKIYPFSLIMKYKIGGETLMRNILELGFLRGGLPQGSPLSPMLTNIIMIPIDYTIANGINEAIGNNFVYTRYADDFQISCKYNFSIREVEKYINGVLKEFNAPFEINRKKTRYGSSSGKNFILGVMLNKDNEITVGHKKKRAFQTMLFNYAMDKKGNKPWELGDVQYLEGLRSYYTSIEPECIANIVKHISDKTGIDILKSIKNDLTA